ncbi:MAG: hypothetical protein JNL10_20350 [Verrucomicrobiales bacterium]|nr:hypothetical protein [Verrucomicrobiales bacterium]
MGTPHRSFVSHIAVQIAAFLGTLVLGCTPVAAAKLAVTVTPASLQAHGFSMQVEDRPDGMRVFTLRRDLSRAPSVPADSGLRIARDATLRIVGAAGVLGECEVAPDTRNSKGTVTYRFVLSRECLAHSSLMLAEDQDYADPTRERLIGGGTHFHFDLSLFVPEVSKAGTPRSP